MFLFSARKIGDFGFALPVSVSLSRGNVLFIWRGCSEQGHYLYVELLLWSVVFVGAKDLCTRTTRIVWNNQHTLWLKFSSDLKQKSRVCIVAFPLIEAHFGTFFYGQYDVSVYVFRGPTRNYNLCVAVFLVKVSTWLRCISLYTESICTIVSTWRLVQGF